MLLVVCLFGGGSKYPVSGAQLVSKSNAGGAEEQALPAETTAPTLLADVNATNTSTGHSDDDEQLEYIIFLKEEAATEARRALANLCSWASADETHTDDLGESSWSQQTTTTNYQPNPSVKPTTATPPVGDTPTSTSAGTSTVVVKSTSVEPNADASTMDSPSSSSSSSNATALNSACHLLCHSRAYLRSLHAFIKKMSKREWEDFTSNCPYLANAVDFVEANQHVTHTVGALQGKTTTEATIFRIQQEVLEAAMAEEVTLLPPDTVHTFAGRPETQGTNISGIMPESGGNHQEMSGDAMGGGPSWNLDRLDQRDLPLDRKEFGASGTGEHAIIYVVDSGIRASHGEFRDPVSGKSRVAGAVNFVSDGDEFQDAGGDCYGHGTMVASLAAGKTKGVASHAQLVSVRVLDCGGLGTVTDVVEGLQWIASEQENRAHPGVVTLSLGLFIGSASRSLERAVKMLMTKYSVTIVTAAGNFNRVIIPIEGNANGDACGLSPSNVPTTITVAASGQTDGAWEYSNTGSCVDIFAPGVRVSGASFHGDDMYAIWSGTSMSVPQVAGVAALLLKENKLVPASEIKRMILDMSTKGRITATFSSVVLANTPNRLLFIEPKLVSGQSMNSIPAEKPMQAESFVQMALPSFLLEGWGT